MNEYINKQGDHFFSESLFLLFQVGPQHQSSTKSLPEGPEVPLKSPVGLLCFQAFIRMAVDCWQEAEQHTFILVENAINRTKVA